MWHVQNLPVRHVLDVMHVEKNIADAVLKFVFGDRDTLECRRDMEECGVMRDLHLRAQPNGNTYLKPSAPYVLTPEERVLFINLVSGIRTPTGYAANFGRHIQRGKFVGLKSHDLHCLLEQVIPVCARSLMHPFQRTTLIRLGKCFSRICGKVVHPRDIPSLKLFVCETICLMEICMPPAFFDLMEHVTIHLVDELSICGPVGGRWLYPLERYMGVLKGWVRNKARPEASIASGYISNEALGFCTEYFSTNSHSRRHVWESAEDIAVEGCVLEGQGRRRELSMEEVEDLHNYVLQNSDETLLERRYNTKPSRTSSA